MTEYKRCQGKSYMVCTKTEEAGGYEVHMILENRIPGIVPLQIINAEEGTQYWYDISGRWDLESWADTHKLGSVFLKKMLSALQYAIEQAGVYLLWEDGISLNPRKIFVDMEEKEILFCYTPFEKTSFEEGLRGFMEYYLQHMEHGCQEEIHKCYEVYDKCQGEHVSLEELFSVLYDQATEQKEEAPEIYEEEPQVSRKENKIKPTVEKVKIPWKWNRKLSRMPRKPKRQEDMPCVFEPEEEEAANPTVFLGSETQEIIGELRYEGDGRESNLRIEKAVFLIGNQKEAVDGMISASTVSRFHAKITKEGEDYYIEDLNSTNGTYQNGELLNYRQKTLLQKNDVIKFADERYRFV